MFKFPKFESQEKVACFCCHADLSKVEAEDKGYGAGNGQYGKYCSGCKAHTFYDLEPETSMA